MNVKVDTLFIHILMSAYGMVWCVWIGCIEDHSSMTLRGTPRAGGMKSV